MKTLVLCAALSLALSTGGAIAQDKAGQTQAQTPRTNSTSELNGDPDRMVCKKIVVTGSRLGKKKVCKSVGEWADHRRQGREATDNTVRQSGQVNCVPGAGCG